MNITDYTFKFIADKLSDFIIIADLEKKIKFINAPLLELLECRKEELINKHISVIFGEPFKTMKYNEPMKINIAFRNQTIPLKLTAGYVFDENDIPVNMIIIGRDMRETSRLSNDIRTLRQTIKQKDEETSTRLSFLSDALACVDESVFVTDKNNKIIYCNKKGLESFGFHFEELIGKPTGNLYTSNDIMSFKGNWHGEVTCIKKDRTTFPALLTTSIVKNKNGVEIGLVGVFRDISELKRLVEELEMASLNLEKRVLQRTRELEKSKAQWEKTFNAIEDMVSIHDIDNKIIRVNNAFAAKFNTIPSKLEEKNCFNIFCKNEFNKKLCDEVIQKKKSVQREIESEILGGVFLFTVTPVFNEKGHIESLVHIITDITKRKSLEEQLLQSSKMAAIGILAAGIAHELNNPLTVIMGYTHMLFTDIMCPDRMKSQLQKIYEQCERTKKIVYNLSVFARNYKSSEKKYINLVELITKTIELRSYDLKVKNITILFDFEKSLPEIYINEHQLQQVILNLVNNAVDAILSIRDKGTITIKVYKTANIINIAISDDGCGIEAKNIPKLFDPFFTTKEVGKGTGLGLSISYGIIKEHNGNINVKSQPGKGTEFTLEIPIITAISERKDNEDAKESHIAAKSSGNIIIIDDEEMILDIIVTYLDGQGYNVEGFTESEKALKRIKEKDFNLIITDYRMPNIGGKELYNRLYEYKPEIVNKLIFITGEIADKNSLKFIKEKEIRVLYKPFIMDELGKIVNEVMAEK